MSTTKSYDVQPDNGGWSILWYSPSGAWRDGRIFGTQAEAVDAAESRLFSCSRVEACEGCGGAHPYQYCGATDASEPTPEELEGEGLAAANEAERLARGY